MGILVLPVKCATGLDGRTSSPGGWVEAPSPVWKRTSVDFYLVNKTPNERKCASTHLRRALRLLLRRPAMVERRKVSAADLRACMLQHRNRCNTAVKKDAKSNNAIKFKLIFFFNCVIIMSFFCKTTFDALSDYKQKVDYDCDKGSRPFPSPHRPLLVQHVLSIFSENLLHFQNPKTTHTQSGQGMKLSQNADQQLFTTVKHHVWELLLSQASL